MRFRVHCFLSHYSFVLFSGTGWPSSGTVMGSSSLLYCIRRLIVPGHFGVWFCRYVDSYYFFLAPGPIHLRIVSEPRVFRRKKLVFFTTVGVRLDHEGAHYG